MEKGKTEHKSEEVVKPSELIKSITGLTMEEAVAKIKEAGFQSRVMREEGENFCGTCDLRDDRVNLTVEGGRVQGAWIG